MFNSLLNSSKEYLIPKCSIQNCKKNVFYKIIIINLDNSLGSFKYLETEEIECKEANSEITFNDLDFIEYYFSKIQFFDIQIVRKMPINTSFKYDFPTRKTVLASLIKEPNSNYKRLFNEDEKNSEIYSIELKRNNNKSIYTSEIYEKYIFDFFKEGNKLKLFFLFDFSERDENNNYDEYLKEQTICYNTFIKFYNYCHLYTNNNEFYLYGSGANVKPLNFSNFFNSNTNFFNLDIEKDDYKFNNCENANECFRNCLGKDKLNKFNIIPFIEKALLENSHRFYNIFFIIERNLPDDIDEAWKKFDELFNKNTPTTIVYITSGNNFEELNNTFESKNYNNLIYINIDNPSNNSIDEEEVQNCLNKIRENIINYEEKGPNLKKEKNLIIYKSNNQFMSSINDENEEENDDNNIIDKNNDEINTNNNINENNNAYDLNIISNINMDNINSINIKNKKDEKKILMSSDNNEIEKKHFTAKNFVINKKQNQNICKEKIIEMKNESNSKEYKEIEYEKKDYKCASEPFGDNKYDKYVGSNAKTQPSYGESNSVS